MTSYYAVSGIVPQYSNPSTGLPYSGATLKAYRAGTSTPISIATDQSGVTTLAYAQLNSQGFPVTGGMPFVPHVGENYKLGLFPTVADAIANTNSIYMVDNLPAGVNTLVTPDGATIPTNLSTLLSGVYHCASFGIYTTNTDNATAINDAITRLNQRGGGIIFFPAGTYVTSKITLKSNVFLMGAGFTSTKLLLRASANTCILETSGFSTYKNSNTTIGADPNVPHNFGWWDLHFDGNKANQTVAPTDGLVQIYGASFNLSKGFWGSINSKGGAFYSEYAANSGSNATDFLGQEEANFGQFFCKNADGYGWLNRGPHNHVLHKFIAQYTRGGWAYENQISANYDGGCDESHGIHTYLTTGDTGIKVSCFGKYNALQGDGEGIIIISNNASVKPIIGTITASNSSSINPLEVNGSIICNVIRVLGNPAASSQTYVKLDGEASQYGKIWVYNSNTTGSNKGIELIGARSNSIGQIYMWGFNSVGYYGFAFRTGSVSSQFNHLVSVIFENSKAAAYTDNATDLNSIVMLTHYDNSASDITWNGPKPTRYAPKNMFRQGVDPVGTKSSGLSTTFNASTTGFKTITVSHNLLNTSHGMSANPAHGNFIASLSQDFTGDFDSGTPRISNITPTTFDITINVTVAASGSQTGRFSWSGSLN